jgi:hypothetical protein
MWFSVWILVSVAFSGGSMNFARDRFTLLHLLPTSFPARLRKTRFCPTYRTATNIYFFCWEILCFWGSESVKSVYTQPGDLKSVFFSTLVVANIDTLCKYFHILILQLASGSGTPTRDPHGPPVERHTSQHYNAVRNPQFQVDFWNWHYKLL